MLEDLRKSVCEANLALAESGLVVETFGNVSGIDRAAGAVVIKPSGLPYAEMKPKHMVVVSCRDGTVIEGDLRPSSDTPTHLVLYAAFDAAGSVVHTHSLYATAWAQARREIPVWGTTHADDFHGPVPVTRGLRPDEIEPDYEGATGRVIVERFAGLDPAAVPAVLVANHGPFVWGPAPASAVHNARILEYVARLASETVRVEPYPPVIDRALLDKHFLRKHGPGSYYGQDADKK